MKDLSGFLIGSLARGYRDACECISVGWLTPFQIGSAPHRRGFPAANKRSIGRLNVFLPTCSFEALIWKETCKLRAFAELILNVFCHLDETLPIQTGFSFSNTTLIRRWLIFRDFTEIPTIAKQMKEENLCRESKRRWVFNSQCASLCQSTTKQTASRLGPSVGENRKTCAIVFDSQNSSTQHMKTSSSHASMWLLNKKHVPWNPWTVTFLTMTGSCLAPPKAESQGFLEYQSETHEKHGSWHHTAAAAAWWSRMDGDGLQMWWRVNVT